MFGITPMRRRQRSGHFPQEFSDFFNLEEWPRFDWAHDYFYGGFKVDIKEEKDGYLFQADLPGVTKDNINIAFDDDYLTVSIKQDDLYEDSNTNYIRRERRQMRTQRSFHIGNVNPDQIQAQYKDGVLEIRVPKGSEELDKRRTIPIN